MSKPKLRQYTLAWLSLAAFMATVTSAIVSPILAQAAPISVSGSLDVTATVLPTAPTTQAVITQPVSGSRVQTTPIVLQGTCGADLLVRVFNNSVLAGSITCSAQGDFTMNITLQIGENVLTSFNFDSFEQAGPNAPAVTIYVDEVTDQPEAQPSGAISEDGTFNAEITTPQTSSTLPTNYQRLFEGTFVEPLAKALDISAIVTPTTNTVVAVAMNGMFIIAILGLVAILLL